ncbi:MAG: DUF501 domain-containing protein [Firmicutes bacterium]|nr:DUF501 domain-containing protein [Bacillota bacterium]
MAKITRQLGRPPRGVVGVVRRCLAGHPQVITSYPIHWGDPPEIFPTLYWLTCPVLKQSVGALETEGWINKLQQRMKADRALAEQWARSHDEYARERVQLVPQEELLLIKQRYPGQARALEQTGIGGARGRGIKCLHMHLAHYLADSDRPQGEVNPIGKVVARLLTEQGVRLVFCYDQEAERFCRGHETQV